MSRAIDWSKAGTRLRHQPRRDGHNPDWNWIAKRWKNEAEYWADDLTVEQAVALVACTNCGAPPAEPCRVRADICTPRRRAAGEEQLRREGPRYSAPSEARP